MKKNIFLGIFGGLLVWVMVFLVRGNLLADSSLVDFEDPPFSLASVNGQDGWSATGPYDQEVYDVTGYSYPGFGDQSLRVSDAVTSGSFGDWIFAKPLTDAVGETVATTNGFPEGTRQTHFETEFDIASADPENEQPGLHISLSPDRGDGSRMSYLAFDDTPTGMDVTFYDVQGTSNPANFVGTLVADDLDRTIPHHVMLKMDVVDGPSNDVVEVWIDGALVHTGTSWENYYRYDSEASAEQFPRIIRTVIIQARGTAHPANDGKGYLFDNLMLLSSTPEADEEAPDVMIDAPEDGDVVSGMVDIFGTVEDDNPDHYWLVVKDSSDATVAGPGTVNDTTSFVNKNLFTWDTTLVPDGEYTIKLEARDAFGNKDEGSVDWNTVTVNNTPDDKAQCMNNGWKSFLKPLFKNQGDCVSYLVSSPNAKGNKKDN